MAEESDSQSSQSSQTLASLIRQAWLKDNTLTAKTMCKKLGLPYKKYGDYTAHIISRTRYDYKNDQGLKCLNIHQWHGWLYAPKILNRQDASTKGWIQTKAKNHYLLWKDSSGRLEWHESGRIKVFVKKPVTEGKKRQLLANAFFRSGLIAEINIFDAWAKTLRMKGCHYPYELGYRVPYRRITDFSESNGVEIVLGDRSHPNALEIKVTLPDWTEKAELAHNLTLQRLELNDKVIAQNTQQISKFNKFLSGLIQPKSLSKSDRRMVV